MRKLSEIPGKFARHRIVSFLILFLILVGLCIYYYDNFMLHEQYATLGTIMKNYPEGDVVAVSGSVMQSFNDGFYIGMYYNRKLVYFKVYSPTKVNLGDEISVLGVLGPDYQIDAKEVSITYNWSYKFILIRSFIAFLFLVFIFNRYWRFDLKNKEFIRRR